MASAVLRYPSTPYMILHLFAPEKRYFANKFSPSVQQLKYGNITPM